MEAWPSLFLREGFRYRLLNHPTMHVPRLASTRAPGTGMLVEGVGHGTRLIESLPHHTEVWMPFTSPDSRLFESDSSTT